MQRTTHTNTTLAHANDDPCDVWLGIGDILRRNERLSRALEQEQALREFCDAEDNARFVTTYTRFRG